jgi:hypothetical protein
MLQFPKRKLKLSGKAQSGFYIDFIFKKLADVFIRNVLIFSALFFGEKYMIEHLTKKLVDTLIFNSNKLIGLSLLSFKLFFYLMLIIVVYILLLLNLIILFL